MDSKWFCKYLGTAVYIHVVRMERFSSRCILGIAIEKFKQYYRPYVNINIENDLRRRTKRTTDATKGQKLMAWLNGLIEIKNSDMRWTAIS